MRNTVYERTGCIMATDDTFYVPGENTQCENPARFMLPSPLNEYIPNGIVCKQHIKILLRNKEVWLKAFVEKKIPKALDIRDLQTGMARQAFFSHVIVEK